MEFELEPDNRGRTDEELLADLRAVAAKLSTSSPTGLQYNEFGRFACDTLKRRFGGWNAALKQAGLVPGLEQNITADVYVADLQRVAEALGASKLTRADYDRHGKYSGEISRRLFGSWDNAVAAAGLKPGWNTRISDEELFDNLERVWRHLGRQPRIRDMTAPLSKYSSDTYRDRFHGWRKALEAFVAAVNDKNSAPTAPEAPSPATCIALPPANRGRRTPRSVGWRLRFLTLRRDGFRCKACGRSPATDVGVELEVDHVLAWSEGGETELENLQALCEKCNGGKSNLPFQEL